MASKLWSSKSPGSAGNHVLSAFFSHHPALVAGTLVSGGGTRGDNDHGPAGRVRVTCEGEHRNVPREWLSETNDLLGTVGGHCWSKRKYVVCRK